jgi:hypothetical protein
MRTFKIEVLHLVEAITAALVVSLLPQQRHIGSAISLRYESRDYATTAV